MSHVGTDGVPGTNRKRTADWSWWGGQDAEKQGPPGVLTQQKLKSAVYV